MRIKDIFLMIVVFIFVTFILVVINEGAKLTGRVVNDDEGCCLDICMDVRQGCDEFVPGEKCDGLIECNLGCCIDKEGYCYGNYLKKNCQDKGYEFIDEHECEQEFRCTGGDSGKKSFYGYPNVIGRDKGYSYAVPMAGKKGDVFKFYGLLYNNDSNQEMKVRIYSDDYEEFITLYNDGNHDDYLADDKIYAGEWNSGGFPSDEHIEKVSFETIINNVSSLKVGSSNYIPLSSNDCIPITKPWTNPNETVHYIFVSDVAGVDEDMFKNNILSLVSQIEGKNYFTGNISNYYMVKGDVDNAKTECTFYNKTDDYIVYVTDTIADCTSNSSVVSVNFNFQMKNDAYSGNSSAIKDLCNHVIIPENMKQDLIALYSPPDVTLNEPNDGDVLNMNNFNVSFIINSKRGDDANFTYDIYVDDNLNGIVKSGDAVHMVTKKVEINLNSSDHTIWVEVEDDKGNLGHSDMIDITVN